MKVGELLAVSLVVGVVLLWGGCVPPTAAIELRLHYSKVPGAAMLADGIADNLSGNGTGVIMVSHQDEDEHDGVGLYEQDLALIHLGEEHSMDDTDDESLYDLSGIARLQDVSFPLSAAHALLVSSEPLLCGVKVGAWAVWPAPSPDTWDSLLSWASSNGYTVGVPDTTLGFDCFAQAFHGVPWQRAFAAGDIPANSTALNATLSWMRQAAASGTFVTAADADVVCHLGSSLARADFVAATRFPGAGTVGFGHVNAVVVPKSALFPDDSLAAVARMALTNCSYPLPAGQASLRGCGVHDTVFPVSEVAVQVTREATDWVSPSKLFLGHEVLEQWELILNLTLAGASPDVLDAALVAWDELRVIHLHNQVPGVRFDPPPSSEPRTGPLHVHVTNAVLGAQIYATLDDGVVVNSSLPQLTAPIFLNTPGRVVIRARAYAPDGSLTPSTVTTAEFWISEVPVSAPPGNDSVTIAIIVSITMYIGVMVVVGAYVIHRNSTSSVVYSISAAEDVLISPEEVEVKQILGEGSFGTVYQGIYKQSQCAVKRAHVVELSPEELKAFVSEAKVLLSLRHPHIVMLMGIMVDPPSLVTELMVRGTLYEAIHRYDLLLDRSIIIQWAHQICQGLLFLQSSGVVHGDIKSPNVLFGSTWTPKIADFGLSMFKATQRAEASEIVSHTHTPRPSPHSPDSPNQRRMSLSARVFPAAETGDISVNAAASVYWAAPEVILDKTKGGALSIAADAYAFGVVLWEMATRAEPYGGNNPIAVAMDVSQHGRRPDMSLIPTSLLPLRPLIESLLHETPNARIGLDVVGAELDAMYEPATVVMPSTPLAPAGEVVVLHISLPGIFPLVTTDAASAAPILRRLHDFVRERMGTNGAILAWTLASVTAVVHRPAQAVEVTGAICDDAVLQGHVLVCIARGVVSKGARPNTVSGPVVARINAMAERQPPGIIADAEIVVDLVGSSQGVSGSETVLAWAEGALVVATPTPAPEQVQLGAGVGSPQYFQSLLGAPHLFMDGATTKEMCDGALDSWPGLSARLFLVTLPSSGKKVVFKRLHNQSFSPSVLIDLTITVAEASLAGLDSPYLAGPVGMCVEPPYVGLVLDYFEDGSLADLVADPTGVEAESPAHGIQLTPALAQRCAMGITTCLAVLHETIAHGSLRPTNVFLLMTPDKKTVSNFFLADFGLAEFKNSTSTMTVAPTVAYMAPELIAGDEESPESDVFVLGSMLYELVVHEKAFAGRNAIEMGMRLLSGARPPLDALPVWGPIIERCWNPDKTQRPTANDVLQFLSEHPLQ